MQAEPGATGVATAGTRAAGMDAAATDLNLGSRGVAEQVRLQANRPEHGL